MFCWCAWVTAVLRTAVPAGGAELQEELDPLQDGALLSPQSFSTFLPVVKNMPGHIKPYQGLEKYRSTHGLKFKKIN